MTYQEKVKQHIKAEDYVAVPVVLLVSVFLTAGYALVFVDGISYLSNNFGATFFIAMSAIAIISFSFLNLYYLKLVWVNFKFNKADMKAYTENEDISLELMAIKSLIAPFFIGMTFLVERGFPIGHLSGLLFIFFISLFVSFVLAGAIIAAFFAFMEHRLTKFAIQKPLFVPTNVLFVPEWDSLHRLLHEAKRKDLLDLETEHGLNADIERLDKTIQLFVRLSAEKQGVMQEEIQSMFLQVEKNIQEAIDTQDVQLIQEIKKQQLLLNK